MATENIPEEELLNLMARVNQPGGEQSRLDFYRSQKEAMQPPAPAPAAPQEGFMGKVGGFLNRPDIKYLTEIMSGMGGVPGESVAEGFNRSVGDYNIRKKASKEKSANREQKELERLVGLYGKGRDYEQKEREMELKYRDKPETQPEMIRAAQWMVEQGMTPDLKTGLSEYSKLMGKGNADKSIGYKIQISKALASQTGENLQSMYPTPQLLARATEEVYAAFAGGGKAPMSDEVKAGIRATASDPEIKKQYEDQFGVDVVKSVLEKAGGSESRIPLIFRDNQTYQD